MSLANPTNLSSVPNIVPLPTSLASVGGPYPTNAWWGNLYLGTSPINCQPYSITPNASGMNIAIPILSYTVNGSGVAKNIATAQTPNVNLLASESLSSYVIRAYDKLTVTVRWPGATSGYIQSCLRQGDGLMTMQYSGLTPRVTFAGTITTINGVPPSGTITGTKFKLVLSGGSTWVIYSSQSISFTASTSQLVSTGIFTGFLQLGRIGVSGDEAVLDNSRGIYVTAGKMNITVVANIATLVFNYTTTGSGNLLTHILPHHSDVIQSPTYAGISYTILKGPTKGIYGSSWTIRETLPTLGFKPSKPINAGRIAAIKAALLVDIAATYNNATAVADPYFGAKYMAKWARLAQIADEVGDSTSAATARSKIKTSLIAWLDATNTNKLLYDTTWGGIITTNGSLSSGADFGNGVYNDHHFHYGYFLYTAAVLAKGDASFLSAYKTKVDQLVKDIANPTPLDLQAPEFRMKDWYHGHSWAHGITSQGSSKDQESSSEAVNAYYGMVLWGLASGNNYMVATGQVLLATEIHSTRRYYHVKTGSVSYPPTWWSNNVSGIIFDFKIDNTTFFGSAEELVHGIQMIPVVPISELILEQAWVAEEYPALMARLNARSSPISITKLTGGSGYTTGTSLATTGGSGAGLLVDIAATAGVVTSITSHLNTGYALTGTGYVDSDVITVSGGGGSGATGRLTVRPADTWMSLITSAQAMLDNNGAWAKANSLATFDDGNTLTNLLHFIATRFPPNPGIKPVIGVTSPLVSRVGIGTNAPVVGQGRQTVPPIPGL